MTKQELIKQLENIIETLAQDEVLITRVSVDHMPSYSIATGHYEGKPNNYRAFITDEEFELSIHLKHPLEKEVD